MTIKIALMHRPVDDLHASEDEDREGMREQTKPVQEGDLLERPAADRAEAREERPEEEESRHLERDTDDGPDHEVHAVLELGADVRGDERHDDPERGHLSLPGSGCGGSCGPTPRWPRSKGGRTRGPRSRARAARPRPEGVRRTATTGGTLASGRGAAQPPCAASWERSTAGSARLRRIGSRRDRAARCRPSRASRTTAARA